MKVMFCGKQNFDELSMSESLVESRYNVFWNMKNGIGLFNNLTNSMVTLSREEREMMLSDDRLREKLYVLGFLINRDFDEYKCIVKAKNRIKQAGDINIIVIAPTTACNMKCPYCFEQGYILNEKMTLRNEQMISEYILKNYVDKNLTIIWYGGEPLLNVEQIVRISQQIKKAVELKGNTYTSGMISNGYLLDHETVDVLYQKCNVRLAQITLDGYGEYHNSRRVLKNGEKSFTQIIDNIDYASQYMKISLRINVDEDNLMGVHELLEFYKKRTRWSNVVAYVAPVTKVHEEMDYEAAMPRADFSEIYKNHFLDFFIEEWGHKHKKL